MVRLDKKMQRLPQNSKSSNGSSEVDQDLLGNVFRPPETRPVSHRTPGMSGTKKSTTKRTAVQSFGVPRVRKRTFARSSIERKTARPVAYELGRSTARSPITSKTVPGMAIRNSRSSSRLKTERPDMSGMKIRTVQSAIELKTVNHIVPGKSSRSATELTKKAPTSSSFITEKSGFGNRGREAGYLGAAVKKQHPDPVELHRGPFFYGQAEIPLKESSSKWDKQRLYLRSLIKGMNVKTKKRPRVISSPGLKGKQNRVNFQADQTDKGSGCRPLPFPSFPTDSQQEILSGPTTKQDEMHQEKCPMTASADTLIMMPFNSKEEDSKMLLHHDLLKEPTESMNESIYVKIHWRKLLLRRAKRSCNFGGENDEKELGLSLARHPSLLKSFQVLGPLLLKGHPIPIPGTK